MTDAPTAEPPPPAPPKPQPEGPPLEPREGGRPTPQAETGEWVWVVFWRPFAMPGNAKHGTWEAVPSRVLAASETTVCHEVSSQSAAPEDAANDGSLTRWTVAERVFRTEPAAREMCRSLPAPT